MTSHSFIGSQGRQLAAHLEQPSRTPAAFALFAHCFTCSKDLKSAIWISRALAERGIAVLRFDFSGIGQSEGSFTETTFSSNVEDLVAAAGFLRVNYRAPDLLFGHSLGGAATMVAAGRIPEATTIALLATPSDTPHFADTLERIAPKLVSDGEATVTLGPGRFRIRQELLADLRNQNVRAAVESERRRLIILHSPDDRIVPIEHGLRLFEWANHPKSFIALDGADHLLLSSRDHARFVAEILAAFSLR